jgi:hypothetical protein
MSQAWVHHRDPTLIDMWLLLPIQVYQEVAFVILHMIRHALLLLMVDHSPRVLDRWYNYGGPFVSILMRWDINTMSAFPGFAYVLLHN